MEKVVVTSTASITETFGPVSSFPAISSSVSPHIGVKMTLPNQVTSLGEEMNERANKAKELSLKEQVAKTQMEEHFEHLNEIFGYIKPDSNKLSVPSFSPRGGKEYEKNGRDGRK